MCILPHSQTQSRIFKVESVIEAYLDNGILIFVLEKSIW